MGPRCAGDQLHYWHRHLWLAVAGLCAHRPVQPVCIHCMRSGRGGGSHHLCRSCRPIHGNRRRVPVRERSLRSAGWFRSRMGDLPGAGKQHRICVQCAGELSELLLAGGRRGSSARRDHVRRDVLAHRHKYHGRGTRLGHERHLHHREAGSDGAIHWRRPVFHPSAKLLFLTSAGARFLLAGSGSIDFCFYRF